MTRKAWHATMLGRRCTVHFERYRNGGVAIQLVTDDQVREPYDTVTTWIPGLAADEVAIRDDEITTEDGTDERHPSMVKAEIIYPQEVRRRRAGWIEIPVYRLTPAAAFAAGGGK